MDPYIGEIRAFGFNFDPVGWDFCDGHLLSISQYQALFSLIGNRYGGDGKTNFAVPDLRGKYPMHFSTNYPLAVAGGAENITLTTGQMPAHTHSLAASSANAASGDPTGNTEAKNADRDAPPRFNAAVAPLVAMNAASIGQAGQNQSHSNMPPYLPVNWCIAIEGTYPSHK
jgi:microcystin-dependent protein